MTDHKTLSGAALMLVLSGCAHPQPPAPIRSPRVPAIVHDAELMSAQDQQDTRAVVVPGQEPAPTPPKLPVAAPAPGDIRLDFPGADAAVVAKAVLGDILHVNYSIDPAVTQKVTLVTPGGVARSAVFGLFEAALKDAGLAAVRVGDGFAIRPIAAAQGQGLSAPDALGFGTEVVTLQFVSADQIKKVFDGILPGVVSSTDPSRSTLTISGTTGQRENARALLKQFDVNWLRNMTFALYVPQRTDSRLIVPELEKLIDAPDSPTRGLVRMISMERLNGILAISRQPQYLDDVRRWIDILDRETSSNEPKLFVYNVQNGRSRDLARTLNSAFGNATTGSTGSDDPFADRTGTGAALPDDRAAAQQVPPANPATNGANGTNPNGTDSNGGNGKTLRSRITSDEVNNAVIVFGTPREYAVIEDALRKLDVPPAQVLIEAAITEVSLTDDLRFGVQWNFQAGNANFALTNDTQSTTKPIQNVPGFSFLYTNNSSVSAALNALEARTHINVVSAPKLVVLNNHTAALQVGDQVPILTQQQQSTNNSGSAPIINSVEYRDTGVILKVTPRVNSGGVVLLDIAQEVSAVSNRTVSGTSSPVISTRRVSTSIMVHDGQVIALGGLFRDSKSFGKDGLPILSRIPVLGSLFGRNINTQDRTELIVILKPHVIHSVDDGDAVTEELRAKLRTLEPFKTTGKMP